MKQLIEQVSKAYTEISTALTDSKSSTKINPPKSLTQALAGKNSEQVSLILENVLPILTYIQKNSSELETKLSAEPTIRIPKTETDSKFNFQIIQQDNGKYLIAISYKRKVTDWFSQGASKMVKEALVLEVDGENLRWFKAVDSVLTGQANMKKGIEEAKITAEVPGNNVQKIYQGSSYTGKDGSEKLSLISEYAQGGDVRDSIIHKEGGHDLSFTNMFYLCYGITANLHEFHQNKVTHGDYNAGNIFLYHTEIKELKEPLLRPVIADLETTQINVMDPNKVQSDIEDIGNTMKQVFSKSLLMQEKSYHSSQKPYLEGLSALMRTVANSIIKDTGSLLGKLNDIINDMVKNKVEGAEILAGLISKHYPQAYSLSAQPKPTASVSVASTASCRLPGAGGTITQPGTTIKETATPVATLNC